MTTPEEVPDEFVDEFQVEELEERVEFGNWGCSTAENEPGDCSPNEVKV